MPTRARGSGRRRPRRYRCEIARARDDGALEVARGGERGDDERGVTARDRGAAQGGHPRGAGLRAEGVGEEQARPPPRGRRAPRQIGGQRDQRGAGRRPRSAPTGESAENSGTAPSARAGSARANAEAADGARCSIAAARARWRGRRGVRGGRNGRGRGEGRRGSMSVIGKTKSESF
jgi:hypothetical protein